MLQEFFVPGIFLLILVLFCTCTKYGLTIVHVLRMRLTCFGLDVLCGHNTVLLQIVAPMPAMLLTALCLQVV